MGEGGGFLGRIFNEIREGFPEKEAEEEKENEEENGDPVSAIDCKRILWEPQRNYNGLLSWLRKGTSRKKSSRILWRDPNEDPGRILLIRRTRILPGSWIELQSATKESWKLIPSNFENLSWSSKHSSIHQEIPETPHSRQPNSKSRRMVNYSSAEGYLEGSQTIPEKSEPDFLEIVMRDIQASQKESQVENPSCFEGFSQDSWSIPSGIDSSWSSGGEKRKESIENHMITGASTIFAIQDPHEIYLRFHRDPSEDPL